MAPVDLTLFGLVNRFQANCLAARVRLDAATTIGEVIDAATVVQPSPVQALAPELPEFRALQAEAAARALVIANDALFRVGAEPDEGFDAAVEGFRSGVLVPMRASFATQCRALDAELALLINRRASIWGRL
jgi:hypothetical protein